MFDMLKQDHRTVERLLDELIAACRRDEPVDRQKLEKLCTDLDLHMQVEEQFLYPKAEKDNNAARVVQDGYQEHSEIKQMLGEVRAGQEGKQLQSTLERMQQKVEHHVKDEENKMFPTLERDWDDQSIRDISQKMRDMKERELASRR